MFFGLNLRMGRGPPGPPLIFAAPGSTLPSFPRLLYTLSRPRSPFPSGDDRASCAARCSLSDVGFAGDEYPNRTGASPATNIRQGYASLFPSLPILLLEIKHPNP